MLGENIPDLSQFATATGSYCCSRCGQVLFEANKAFAAGCGFPSFWQHWENGVLLHELHTYGRSRIQLLCGRCGLHLGHLFANKHTPTQQRYCINAESIRFTSGACPPAC